MCCKTVSDNLNIYGGRIMNSFRDKIYIFIEIILHILPVKEDRIFFSSFHCQYNDNPKYISVKLHEIAPHVRQYWVLSEKSKENDLPSYVETIRYNTLKYCWIKNRCRIIVENGAGAYIYNTSKRFTIKRLLKNHKQFDISTWHGNPIKHIGAQIPENQDWNENTFNTTSDVMLSGCEYVKEVFEKAFLNKMPVLLLGTPRTDILFNLTENKKKKVKQKLGLPIDKKIVLYAPTYRNNPEDSGVIQMRLFDFHDLFSALSKRFGGEWVFVFRVHNMVLLKINTKEISEQYGGRVLNGNVYDDMMEYMAASDALITDYSGCIFDNAHSKIPCFLFAHDRENYLKIERGTYIHLNQLPYPFADTFADLKTNIIEYDDKECSERVDKFQRYIGNIEDGKASDRVCQLILRKLAGN